MFKVMISGGEYNVCHVIIFCAFKKKVTKHRPKKHTNSSSTKLSSIPSLSNPPLVSPRIYL